ncbi:hypothetical protein ES705_03635 [subsurface metagenome]
MVKRKSIILSLCLVLVTSVAMAVGLKTYFGEVVVENLRIGQTYNLRDLVNLPLEVINTSDYPVDLEMELQYPGGRDKRSGYEPIPSLDWIKLTKTYFTVEPGASAITDVIVSIPDDEKYLGKKYQVNIWSGMPPGKRAFAAALLSRLLITIAPERKAGKVIPPEKRKKIISSLDFYVTPPNIVVRRLKVGKKVDVERFTGQTLKIMNPNDKAFTYRVSVKRVKDSLAGLKSGFEDTPDASFLTLDKTEVKAGPLSIKEVKMFLDFPEEEQYKGKNYMFIISVEVLGQEIKFSRYAKLFVFTRK